MIDGRSLDAVAAQTWDQQFIKPLYDGYAFAQIPNTIRALLGGERGGIPLPSFSDQPFDAVIVLLIDAFGWRFAERYLDHPFLRRFADNGVIVKLTSQFPSTTSAHVTTMHSGLPVGAHGVYEWFMYEPQLDAVIAPLLWSFAGDRDRETLRKSDLDPRSILPAPTFYEQLTADRISSTVFHNIAYAHSPYSTAMTRGATVVPYRTLPEALVNLAQRMAAQKTRSYYYLYWEAIDTICHWYGPDSPQVAAEIEAFLDTVERVLQPQLRRSGGRTLLLLTADHGQTAIDPATTIYLNTALPDLLPLLQTNKHGDSLAPVGSSRDMFLHIRPGQIDAAEAMIRQLLAGRADVRRVDDLIAQGFFGSNVSDRFRTRVGDLVILPFAGESVWWYEAGRFEQRFRGSHGGLLRDELETIVLAQVLG
jgi:predicted AlkP superfamily pyrophosphatase or phosphodiesterase